MDSVERSFGKSLIEAVKENDVHFVKVLLEQGARVNAVDECGYTALHWAALYDKPECAHALLTHGSRRCDIDFPDKDGYTALQLGIRHGHKNITQLLVTYGADINANTHNLPSPVDLAKKIGFDDILTVLQLVQEKNASSQVPKLWKLGKLLGCGGFAKVYVGYDLEMNREIAIKKLKKTGRKSSMNREVNELESEIKVLKNLNHRNIVQYFGMEKDKSTMYIFMEYLAGGSLRDYVLKHGGVGEEMVRFYSSQVLEGVAYLHASMIVHRDIKGANILLTLDCKQAKVADFGLSKKIQRSSTRSALNTTLGSPYWMAPEVVKASPTTGECYGRKADIWSIGCTIIEMLTGKPPWSEMEPMTAVYNIGTGRKPPELPASLSGSLRDFLLQTFKRDPKSRPFAKDLINHPFITNESSTTSAHANLRIRRSIDTINKHILKTFQHANWVRRKYNNGISFTSMLFLLTLLLTLLYISDQTGVILMPNLFYIGRLC